MEATAAVPLGQVVLHLSLRRKVPFMQEVHVVVVLRQVEQGEEQV